MKKGLLTLATLALAFSVSAQDAPKPAEAAKPAGVTISANVKGGLIWARFTQAIKPGGAQNPTAVNSSDWDFIDTRMRPWFIISNGETKAVLGLEIDGHMGGGRTGSNLKYDTSYIPQNGDRTNIEVNECYYETNVKAVKGLTITAGLLEYKFPVYNFGDQNDQFKVTFKQDILNASALYMRWSEGGYQNNCDNSHVWIADITASVGPAKIRPAVFYVKSGNQVPDERYVSAPGSTLANTKFSGKTGLIYGINADVKAGTIGLTATFLNGSGKSQRAQTAAEAAAGTPVPVTKYSGYAGKVEVSADVAVAKVKLFLNFTSGDKKYGNATNTDHKDWQSMTFDTVGDGNTFILEDKGHSLMTDGKPSRMRVREANPWGYQIIGLQGELKPIPDLAVKVVLAYGQLAVEPEKNTTNINMKRDLGIEADLQLLYTLGAGTQLVVEGAYLKTGKAHEGVYQGTNGQGAWTARATVAQGKATTNNVTYIGLGTKYGF